MPNLAWGATPTPTPFPCPSPRPRSPYALSCSALTFAKPCRPSSVVSRYMPTVWKHRLGVVVFRALTCLLLSACGCLYGVRLQQGILVSVVFCQLSGVLPCLWCSAILARFCHVSVVFCDVCSILPYLWLSGIPVVFCNVFVTVCHACVSLHMYSVNGKLCQVASSDILSTNAVVLELTSRGLVAHGVY